MVLSGRRLIRLSLTIVGLSIGISLSAVVPRHANLIEQYKKGNSKVVADSLKTFKHYNNVDSAFYNLYMGKLASNIETSERFFLEAIKKGRNTEYYPEICLEMGKIRFFERRYKDALEYLACAKDYGDTHFWKARAYYKQAKNYRKARSAARAYIETSKDIDKVKLAYYTIADSWAETYDHDKAIDVLVEMGEKYPDLLQSQYYLLKLGNYQFKTDAPKTSYEFYKQVILIDRLSSYAFEAEKQLYVLKTLFKDSIDLACLYPGEDVKPENKPVLPLKKITKKKPKQENKVEHDKALAEIRQNYLGTNPVRVDKPGEGIYLQLGRFGVENNASNLVTKVRSKQINCSYFKTAFKEKDSFVVLAGPFTDGSKAGSAKKVLKTMQINSFLKVINE